MGESMWPVAMRDGRVVKNRAESRAHSGDGAFGHSVLCGFSGYGFVVSDFLQLEERLELVGEKFAGVVGAEYV